MVPDANPTRPPPPLPPPKMRLVFRMRTARSRGESVRFDKGFITADPHASRLYADRLHFQAQNSALHKENKALRAELVHSRTTQHLAERAAHLAQEELAALPDAASFSKLREELASADREKKKASASLHTTRREAGELQRRYDSLVLKSFAGGAALQAKSAEAKQLAAKLETATTRANTFAGRAKHALQTVARVAEECKATQSALDATSRNLVAAVARASRAGETDARVGELELELTLSERRQSELEEALSSEMRKTAPKRGRPFGHRGAEWLSDNWDAYNAQTRRKAFYRHCIEIKDLLESSGVDDWLPAALACVLDGMQAGEGDDTWVDYLWSTRPFAKRKNRFVASLKDIAQAEWGLDLSHHALKVVGLSERGYQELRNAFSRSIFMPPNSVDDADPRAGMYSPRSWYKCAVTGQSHNLPEPLLPMYKVRQLMAEKLQPLGLHMSVDGKISERSFLETLRSTFVRDGAHLKVFDVRRPAHPCFGIDHASISGARDFTQGGITLGACYKKGALLSEQKHVTLCIGLHHDDGKGLAQMLGSKEASVSAGESRPAIVGIAAEFAELSDSGILDMDSGVCVPCEPVVCLDFAAWRGITRKRGKCSAICACRGLAKLQSYPGANGIPDLPAGDSIADLHVARAMAQDQCGYGTPLLARASLEMATHILPKNWDFERDGDWCCTWCNKTVWTAPGQQEKLAAELAALRERIASGSPDTSDRKEAKKKLDALLKEHAELHGDALLLDPLIMKNQSGTKPFIVDPMHCLTLNLMKTLWKYSFGDRMTDGDRELVAEYLSSIGLYLDIRAKGKRDPGTRAPPAPCAPLAETPFIGTTLPPPPPPLAGSPPPPPAPHRSEMVLFSAV